jgi:hypothetical protein
MVQAVAFLGRFTMTVFLMELCSDVAFDGKHDALLSLVVVGLRLYRSCITTIMQPYSEKL